MPARTIWIAVIVAMAAVVGVVAGALWLWQAVGSAAISPQGWLALGLGVVLTLALGIGLMTLVFLSSRLGYDEGGKDR